MKTSAILVLAMVASAGVSGAVIFLTSALAPPPAQSGEELASLSAQVAEVGRRLEEIERSTRSRPQSRDLPPLASRAPSEGDIRAMVTEWLESHRNDELVGSAVLAAKKDGDRTETIQEPDWTLEEALTALAGDLSYQEQEAWWARIRESGRIDEVIEAFEANAESSPNDPDVQNALGVAYIQKLQTIDDGPIKGMWANKADKAFDAALALDENHWDARFTKATALAFWPPIFGKQAESVKQFEILIDQQEGSGQRNPGYSQSYVFLGNLYQQQGDVAKAREIWRRGLSQFPEDPQLQEALTANR